MWYVVAVCESWTSMTNYFQFLSLKSYNKLLSYVPYALNRYIITLIVILYASNCQYDKAFIVQAV